MTQQESLTTPFNFRISNRDRDLLRSFRTLLKIDGKTEFCSDDFRMYGLDRFLADTQHGIGGLFAKWVHHGIAEKTGRNVRSVLPSNHLREIKTYKWKKEKAST